jgi:hypothetical protein
VEEVAARRQAPRSAEQVMFAVAVYGLSEHFSPPPSPYVAYHIDLLQEHGPLVGKSHARRLQGQLWALRLHLGTRALGLTYCVASTRRIVLLTVFREDQPTEKAEIRRAVAAMDRYLSERHLTLEDARDHATA